MDNANDECYQVTCPGCGLTFEIESANCLCDLCIAINSYCQCQDCQVDNCEWNDNFGICKYGRENNNKENQ